MWMNPYVQDVLIREQIADAQQRAARNHLLRRTQPRDAPGGAWERLTRRWRRAPPPDSGLVAARRQGLMAWLRAERVLPPIH